MGDGCTHRLLDSGALKLAHEERLRLERRESLRARICDELLMSSSGVTREEVLSRCGVSDADAFALLHAGRVLEPNSDEQVASDGVSVEQESAFSVGERGQSLAGFRWVAGMRLLGGARVLTTEGDSCSASVGVGVGAGRLGWLGSEGLWDPSSPRILDVDDEGTGGCLLSLLGRASVFRGCGADGEWVVTVFKDATGVVLSVGRGSSLGRACVGAAVGCGGWRDARQP